MPSKVGNEYQTLGLALRRLRNHAGLKQAELGARAHIGAVYISQIEHGRRGVRWHTLLQLLAVLDADLHQLADAIAAVEAEASPPE
ncbi:MAG TPA: helix-turn-helix transcriptional regulator [Solirubrobacteraceae bacterium]|jgi:transcriptional regulator with XRE-family HTH domain|nr:helix-turn-helix transcriptional regulator [Solirubrobacteraceae bacterium]